MFTSHQGSDTPSKQITAKLTSKSLLSEEQKKILYAYPDSYTKYFLTKDKNGAAEAISGIWSTFKSWRSKNKFLLAKDPIKLKSEICDRLKQRIRTVTDVDDYIKILIDVSNDAKDAREAGITSVFAICFYALRTRMIHEIQADNKSEHCQKFNNHIANLILKKNKVAASIEFADTVDGNKPDPEDEKEYNDILIELAYLGHGPSIIEANKNFLLGVMPSMNPFASSVSLLTEPNYTPIQPHYKRQTESKETDKPSKPLPVKLKMPMEFQPNLYCWLPHYLSTGAYPKSNDYLSLTENYKDNSLLEKAGDYHASDKTASGVESKTNSTPGTPAEAPHELSILIPGSTPLASTTHVMRQMGLTTLAQAAATTDLDLEFPEEENSAGINAQDTQVSAQPEQQEETKSSKPKRKRGR